MTGRSRVVAVAGIDGSGKTSLIRRFTELWPRGHGDVLTLTCPSYHLTPNAPFARLSEQLHRFSTTSDALGSVALKGAAMYLQMTLHGPVERCLLGAYQPAFLLTEHHSIVDTLAYGAIYTTMIRGNADPALEPPLRAALDSQARGSYDDIMMWASLQARLVGTPPSLFELGFAVARLLMQPRALLVPELTRRYGTGLPDVLLLLDLPVSLALERLAARGDTQRELHEQAPMLEQLRVLYHEVARYLVREHPEVHTVQIDAATSGSVDETLHEVMQRAGMTS